MKRFYLGAHHPVWLSRVDVPLFVSDRRLCSYRVLPRARVDWALDSGGFSELAKHGSWDHGPTPAQYVQRVRRYADEVGKLSFAAPQDWMCEPRMVAKTGLSVLDHQRRTIDNYLHLTQLAPEINFIPVLQGYEPADYLRCIGAYQQAGVDLLAAPLVGVGSVCRRTRVAEVEAVFVTIAGAGLSALHGFGIKIKGLARVADYLQSSDSMAWSYHARRRPPLVGHTHLNCANCLDYALQWRTRLVADSLRA